MKIDDTTREMLSKLPPDFPMTAAQAAALMRISTKTLQRLRNQGLPPPVQGQRPERTEDGRWSTSPVRYRKADVDAWNRNPIMPSVHLHAYQVADSRIIADAPALDDTAIVGEILELLTEVPWAVTALMIEAQRQFLAEQQAEREAVQQAIAKAEREVLNDALGDIEPTRNGRARGQI